MVACEFREPRRDDIILFYDEKSHSTYLKRVVGIPGDTIQMIDVAVRLNGVELHRKRVDDYVDPEGDSIPHYVETLPNSRACGTLDITSESAFDNTESYKVPPEHYFVLGCNRDNSTDSRMLKYIGYVPREHILGRAAIIVFSWNFSRIWTPPS